MAQGTKKTEAQIVVFSTRPPLYYGLGIFLGLFLSSLLISIFYFSGVAVSIEIGIFLISVFLLMVIGSWLIRMEFRSYVKSDYERRPPFFFIFTTLIFMVLLYYTLVIHDPFKDTDFGILPYVTAPVFAAVFGWIIKSIISPLFISILRVFDRFRQHNVLLYKDFLIEMNHRIHDFKRYKNHFSLITLGVWVNDKFKDRLNKMLEYPLLFEIVRRNIRRGDVIGISGRGDHVLILSTHNAHDNASKHADRIINVLNHDPVLLRMIDIAQPEYLYVIEEGHEESVSAEIFVKNSEQDLHAAFVQRDKKWQEENR
ncbi:MAG: hypothetical protein JW904_02375 [Spirochaetales bacterium]|nr:hypothetical protein [Spirochaetales bacterium]